jgi:hypothetical protein
MVQLLNHKDSSISYFDSNLASFTSDCPKHKNDLQTDLGQHIKIELSKNSDEVVRRLREIIVQAMIAWNELTPALNLDSEFQKILETLESNSLAFFRTSSMIIASESTSQVYLQSLEKQISDKRGSIRKDREAKIKSLCMSELEKIGSSYLRNLVLQQASLPQDENLLDTILSSIHSKITGELNERLSNVNDTPQFRYYMGEWEKKFLTFREEMMKENFDVAKKELAETLSVIHKQFKTGATYYSEELLKREFITAVLNHFQSNKKLIPKSLLSKVIDLQWESELRDLKGRVSNIPSASYLFIIVAVAFVVIFLMQARW